MGRLIDLTGQKFGRLVVIKRAEDYFAPCGHKAIQWLCECSCENHTKIIVRGDSLRNNSVVSCGCYNNEQRIKRNKTIMVKSFNCYEIIGNCVKIYNDKKDKFCLIDLEDLNKIKNFHWFNHNGYWFAWDRKNHKLLKLHNFVYEPREGYIVDHIYGERFDNRKEKLREVTSYHNTLNHGLRENNKSGFTGVVFSKSKNKWESYITFNKRRIYLGSFMYKKDAIKARKQAELKYFGEMARK